MKKLNVVIAGCGDVGCELARQLLALDVFDVWGLRRDISKLPAGVKPIKGNLFEIEALGSWPKRIDYLVYSASSDGGTEEQYRSAYVDGLQNVIQRLEDNNYAPRRIFFTSSTSTFHQSKGEWVNEASKTEPVKFTGKIMLDAENLLNLSPFKSTAVRLGGIYGPGRSRLIDRAKRGQGCPKSPEVFSNRIHMKDAAGIISHLIQRDDNGFDVDELYLGVDGQPVTMHEILQWLGEKLEVEMDNDNYPAPQRGNRRCSNDRILGAGYQFFYRDFKSGYSKFL
ncbi:SDR family oxidoreductase [Endozoicomonas ascidiicola]|uniref:SDR family oxidoreductase n=1 Tax=Endozoicomonas ascidiicola TaxID=1698521 RepID=UPI0008333F1C|nr:SDR family oxidoreductase [Endozoicomonas ascidiicola]